MQHKNTIDSIRSSPASSYNKASLYTDDDLDRFQRQLTREKIIDIWKKMREGGNSKDGIVTKDKFKQIFYEYFRNINIKELLVNDIFERFKKKDFGRDEKIDKKRAEEKRGMSFGDMDKGEIDLHDLVVSLAILSTLDPDDKLELCFDLTDIDEDGCLSPDDVCKMLLAIERNFAKECSFIDPENASSLNNLATKKALRKFHYLFLFDGQEDPKAENTNGKPRKDKVLGHFKDFMEKLSKKTYLHQNLLPKIYSLRRVLENKSQEVSWKIHANEEKSFKDFRAELHGRIWNKADAVDSRQRIINPKKEDAFRLQTKEPGRVSPYGEKTEPENKKQAENNNQNLKQMEAFVQEKSYLTDYKKKLKEMREWELPNLDQVMGSKYTKLLKKKESHLPPLGKWPAGGEVKHVDIETPDLNSMIEKRVERLSKQYKHLDVNYKDYLLKKLTSAIGGDVERGAVSSSPQRKVQAYKFLM